MEYPVYILINVVTKALQKMIVSTFCKITAAVKVAPTSMLVVSKKQSIIEAHKVHDDVVLENRVFRETSQ